MKLTNDEINFFTERGIPIIDLIKDRLSLINGKIIPNGDDFEILFDKKLNQKQSIEFINDILISAAVNMPFKELENHSELIKKYEQLYEINRTRNN